MKDNDAASFVLKHHKESAMKFVKIYNLDRNTDEQVNAEHVTRIRDVQSRDQDKCTISFSNGDSLTALGSAEDILAAFSRVDK